MTQRNVLKATVPDGMVGLPKPAYVFAAVRLSKALKDARSKAVAYAENFHGGGFQSAKIFLCTKIESMIRKNIKQAAIPHVNVVKQL